MGEVIQAQERFRRRENPGALNASANLAQEKKTSFRSALLNSALLNVPALVRANRGEKPGIFTVNNAIADLGAGTLWYLAAGIPAVVTGAAIGGAAIIRYNQKKKAA
ncbi:MAG TPA: hypothetical protein VI957_00650 [Candidatus Paceibacterota bacterium]